MPHTLWGFKTMINVSPILEVEDIEVEFSANQQFLFPWQQKKFIKAQISNY